MNRPENVQAAIATIKSCEGWAEPLLEYAESLEQRIASLEKVAEWQTIETAPLDGREILGYGVCDGEINGKREGPSVQSICFAHNEWNLTEGDYYSVTMEPTHWRELPKPPTKE